MRVLLILIALVLPMKAHAAVVVLEEFVGEVCKCDALPTDAVSTDTTTLTDFGNPLGAYYLGYSAVLDVFSDGSQSLTINNHTVHYMPTVGTIWAEFLVDNLGDNFIVWHNNLPNLLGILVGRSPAPLRELATECVALAERTTDPAIRAELLLIAQMDHDGERPPRGNRTIGRDLAPK